jgi:hypothetical protein
MSFLISLFTGGFFKNLFGVFSAWFNTQAMRTIAGDKADAQVITANINAQVELNKLQTQMVMADKGWWVTAWMKPFVFYPFATHAVAVVFDSLPLLGHKIGSWQIPPLPHPYDSMEISIILTVCGIVGLKQVARIFKG